MSIKMYSVSRRVEAVGIGSKKYWQEWANRVQKWDRRVAAV